jgi:hypothetical protein
MADRRRPTQRAVGASAVVASAALGLGLAATNAAARVHATAFRCVLSSTTGRPLPAQPSFNVGSSRIAVSLPAGAVFVAVPEGEAGQAFVQKDGWIRTKLGWWAGRGAPRVTGIRLDGRARPLRADVGPLSYATPGGPFYPSLLFFPSPGCWQITARAGGARLVAVVRVVTQ